MSTKRSNGEGTFTKTAAGTIECRLLVGGVRIKARGRNRAEALRNAKAKADLIAPKQRSSDTFADLFADWCELSLESRRLAATTADNYETLIRRWAMPMLGDLKLSALTVPRMGELLDSITGSNAARRNTYAAIAKVLDFGVDRQRLGANPLRRVQRPNAVHVPKREVSDADAVAIIKAAAGHRFGVGAWLLFGCGMRRGEVLGLRWGSVDLDGAVLNVAVDGNLTRTSRGLLLGKPKTRNGIRQVPIPQPVVDALRLHRQRQLEERLQVGPAWQGSDAVLTNEIGGFVDPRNFSREFGKWARAAGVKGAKTHDGRKYAATMLLASGEASVVDVAATLGHDPSVLLTTYASAASKGQRAAADVLGRSLTTAR